MIFPDEKSRASEFNRINHKWHEKHAKYINQENGEFIGHTALHFFRSGSKWAITHIKSTASEGFLGYWKDYLRLCPIEVSEKERHEFTYQAAVFSTAAKYEEKLTAAQAEIARLREVLGSVDEFIARTPMLNQGELAVMVPRIRKSYEEALNKGEL